MTLPLVYGRFKPLLGRLPGLVSKNHWFQLAKTELENFKNWTRNRIIGSLCLEPELEFLKNNFKKKEKKD
jgi:hypothetical protein